MLATQPAVNLQQLMDGQLQPFQVAAPAGTSCAPGTPDIVIHDDGSGENGYGWNPIANVGRIADKFVPVAYPATISTVCASFITNTGVTSFNFNLVVYAADGAGGEPGTVLGTKAFVGHPASIGGLPFTPTFEAFDISDLALNIAAGAVYISMEWDAAVEPGGVFLGSDESPGTPLNGGYMRADTDPWSTIQSNNPSYKAMLVRAVMPLAGPGAPSVSKVFAPSQVLAGETSTLTIKLNNASQPTAAVLSAALTDTFPAGLVVAPAPNASTTCPSGTVTAVAGSGSVTLSSGAQIPASGSCEIKVDVTSAADGSYVNTIPVGALQTQHGNNAGAATATLKVGFTFPEPYCPVTFPSGIEPITRVVFSNIDNTSPATGGPPLQDFTAIVGNVAPGQTVSIKVEGNTAGNFTTPVAAYIDWNQDGVFDPVTEHYTIGSLVNSTGSDGQQVTVNITVPVDAVSGNTRMRVIKKFNTEAGPCNSAGYGQAEDYTLNVAVGSTAPKVAKAFAPTQVLANSPSTLTITLDNEDEAGAATLVADLVDTFPANLVVADTPNASTTCGSGTVTANAGGGSVTLATGAVIPGGGTCTVKVDVQSSLDGSYVNTIPAGALETDLGNSPFAASATLKVGFTFPEPYCPVAFPSGIEPITRVLYAGIDNTSAATSSTALEDFTAIIGNVVAGQSLNMTVEGNTAGNFSTPVVAYIDWNQDGVFDSSEKYSIGTLQNSTGTDGQQITAAIAAPAGALSGATRLRVIKKYNSEADPCNTSGFGQAEDYTVLVGPAVPSVAKAFSPDTVAEGEDSTLTITVTNPTGSDATLTAPLVDNLPAGMTVSSASTSCGLIIGGTGPVLTASTITLPAGIVLPAGSSCDITATVQAAVAGTYENLIPAGALQTDQGDSAMDASATLTVTLPMIDPVIGVTPGSLSASQGANETTTQTLSIANTGGSDLTWTISEEPAAVEPPPASPAALALRGAKGGATSAGAAAPRANPGPMAVVVNEGFDDIINLPGWLMGNHSSPVGSTDWFQGNDAVFPAFDGAPAAYIGANFNNAGSGGNIDNWLVSPPITFSAGGSVSFYTRTADGSIWADRLEVRVCTSGACTDFGNAYGEVGDFGTVLLSVNETLDPSGYPQTWTQFTANLPSSGSGRIAFRYFVPDNDTNSNYIGIDRVVVDNGGGGGGTCSAPADVSWVSVAPTSGTTPAGGSSDVTVTFDSAGLAPATYAANLCVNSNDPLNPLVVVPVEMTVTGGGGTPIAQVTPAMFDFTVDEGDTGNDTMVVTNIGGGTLTYSIVETPMRNLNPPSYKTAAAAMMTKDRTARPSVELSSSREAGGENRVGDPVQLLATDISQMADNTPGDEGVSCGTQGASTADNSWWRRFYFNEHPAVGSSAAIESVTISTGSIDVTGGLPSTINLYTIPHSVTVDTINTAQLTLIGTANFTASGSLTSITVPVTGTVADTVGMDLVVEWHTDGNASGGQFFPGANATPETHPTFISSTACSITSPTTAAGIGFPNFHLTMIVSVGGGTPPPACDNPTDIPWLSASPTSGALTAGMSDNVAVTVDATGLASGSYAANLCLATNDATQPIIYVPVTMTVEVVISDEIFCSGFEEGETGACTILPPPPFTQPIEDPSFEATTGDGGPNPFWDGFDSNDPSGGTPFYSASGFGIDVHTGDWEAWFGGWRVGDSVQSFSQSVEIASGGPRFINYWRNCVLAPVGPAILTVYVDGTAVETTDMAANGLDPAWVNKSIDISSYADGGTHEIKFEYVVSGASDDGNVFVDDVTIDETAGSPRPAH